MTTSEPTTGEIVRALRNCADATTKKKPCTPECYYFNRTECCAGSLYDNAADRLESQEQKIAALTARAEQAERERDSIEKSLARRIMKHLSDNEFDSTYVCEICEYNLINSPKCLSCGSDHHYGENFELKHTLRG